MPRAWISLGANLGRPQATLTAAAEALEQSEGIAHLRLSSTLRADHGGWHA